MEKWSMANLIMTIFFIFGLFVTYTTIQAIPANNTPFCFGNYLIYNDTSTNNVGARNCKTGLIDFGTITNNGGISGTNFTTVTNKALTTCGNNCRISISTGNFSVTSGNQCNQACGVITIKNNNVFISGSGLGTIITTGNQGSVKANLFYFLGVGDTVTNLAINGKGQNMINGNACLAMFSSGGTVSFTYVKNCDRGIVLGSTFNTATNNLFFNTTNDALVNNLASNSIITNNQINKTNSHNCIASVSSNNSVIFGNTCTNSGTYGIAMENLGSGSNFHNLISSNTIKNSSADGIRVYPTSGGIESADNLTIANNIESNIQNYGININSGNNISIIGGTIARDSQIGINANSANVTGLSISGTQIIKSTLSAINLPNAQRVTITGVNINSLNNGIVLAGSHSSISSSTIVFTSPNVGIDLTGGSFDNIIGNTIQGSTTTGIGIQEISTGTDNKICENTITVSGQGIKSTSDFTKICDNDVRVSVNTPINLAGSGNHSVIINNQGYNPFGARTNFVFGTFFSPIGTSSSVTNNTVYTISLVQQRISINITNTFTIGHTLIIKIDGIEKISLSGLSVTSGLLYSFDLYPAETFQIQFQTGDITITDEGK